MPKHSQFKRPRVSVADLLAAKNPWADWLDWRDEGAIGPLSPWRFAALLLRDVPIAPVINRLGVALMAADPGAQELVDDFLDDLPLPDHVVFGFEHWLEVWNHENGMGYAQTAHDLLTDLKDTRDAALLASMIARGDTDATTELWFILGAAQRWTASTCDPRKIEPGALWLFDLFMEHADDDPLDVLFGYLYGRYRDRGTRPTRPMPERIEGRDWPDQSLLDDSEPTTGTAESTLLAAAGEHELTGGAPSFARIFESDPRSWPQRAGHVSALRTQGFLSGTGFTPTATGLAVANVEQDFDEEAMMPPAESKH